MSRKSIEIVETSMKLDSNSLSLFRRQPPAESNALALTSPIDDDYLPPSSNTGGLLLNPSVLKNENDLDGWEIKPCSFLHNCRITVMVGSTLANAVPAEKGGDDWMRMRGQYIQSKESAIKEVHWETNRVLTKFLDCVEENDNAIDTMDSEALYEFASNVLKVLASLNKVVSPIFSARMPRPSVKQVFLPPVASDPEYTAEILSHWVIETASTTRKALSFIRRQATILSDILNDVKESADEELAEIERSRNANVEEAAEEKDAAYQVHPGPKPEKKSDEDKFAAIAHTSGPMPDSDRSQDLAKEIKLTGLMTFFVRRADYRACQELLDRIGETQDSFDNRGKNKKGSVGLNVLTAIRKVQNQTGKLGVHRTSLMPNEFELVRKMTLFRGGIDSGDLLCEVASRLKPLLFQSSTCVIRSGTIGMGMYFINNGKCNVSVQGSQVAKLGYGDFFGEVALTMASQRTADVEAEGLVELFEFTRRDLKDVVSKYPHLLKRLKDQGRARIKRACSSRFRVIEDGDGEVTVTSSRDSGQRDSPSNQRSGSKGQSEQGLQFGDGDAVDPQIVQRLKFLFEPGVSDEEEDVEQPKLTDKAWRDIVGKMRRVQVREGEKLVGPGVEGNSIYILEAGECHVLINNLKVSGMHPGDFFGEVALMLSIERTAQIVTATPCTLLRLKSEELCDILDAYPALYRNLMSLASKRADKLQKAYEELKGTEPTTTAKAASEPMGCALPPGYDSNPDEPGSAGSPGTRIEQVSDE
mmetsp:Transcript_52683/g.163477  ORF Transcript_52683/g.163477 Transcript_52683/m.163477 type:complete len:756 (-) Transcript_52683:147-2414(-)